MLGPLPCSPQAQRDLKVTKQGYGTAERFRAQDTLLHPLSPTPTQATHGLCPLGASQELKSQLGTSARWRSEDRENTIDQLKGQLQQACVLTRQAPSPTPQNFAQAGSAHTCSIQEFLVHAVSEAAEQAMGSHHTLLQILSGDGIIRIPLLHLTAEGKESHSEDAGSLLTELANTAFHLLCP